MKDGEHQTVPPAQVKTGSIEQNPRYGGGAKRRFVAGFAFLLLPACSTAAQAHVVISSAATKDMTCSAGVCAPTATDAVLNVGDLETLLASGNVEVTTTGAGGVQAYDLQIAAPFSWSAANTLTLDSYSWIFVDRLVQVSGMGGLVVLSDDGTGGYFDCRRGRIAFANLSSPLTVNGASFTFVTSIKSLAAAIANNASGDYALADNYNASQDGTYSNTPIMTTITGNIQGLGNAISNIHVTSNERYVTGLFVTIGFGSTVENLGLAALKIKMGPYHRGESQYAAGLVELNEGLLFNDHVSGKINVDAEGSGGDSPVGGLVSYLDGTISNSYSTAQVTVKGGYAGGLAGGSTDGSPIIQSYAIGAVTGIYEGAQITVGGLVSGNSGSITNSYATGSVEGQGQETDVGGLSGGDAGSYSVSASYSTGR